MSLIDKLTNQFIKFPGIGSRQARRFVYFLLSSDSAFADELIKNIQAIRKEVSQCSGCFRYFEKDSNNLSSCSLCSDPNKDTATLLVVEKDADLEAIRKNGTYRGNYFVLNGRIPLDGLSRGPLPRVKELQNRITELSKDGLREVVFALSANTEGDYTILELKSNLAPLAQEHHLTFSTLGRGLSTGTELEYSDGDTIKNALENRK